AGRPSAPISPSKVSPAEWATMNHGGTPEASRAPIIEPAEVPTMRSALAGSHPVSVASASRPPVSQAPPITPPAPSTSPTRGDPLLGMAQTILGLSVPVLVIVAERRLARLRALARALDVELIVGRDLLRFRLLA